VDDAHDGSYAREPQLDDLVRLARALNAHHVQYVLIAVCRCPDSCSQPAHIRTKNTIRPSDAADRQFLQVLVDEAAR
jgi:hypothetical protein